MPDELNEAIVRRFYNELWNDWNLAVADQILAREVVSPSLVRREKKVRRRPMFDLPSQVR